MKYLVFLDVVYRTASSCVAGGYTLHSPFGTSAYFWRITGAVCRLKAGALHVVNGRSGGFEKEGKTTM